MAEGGRTSQVDGACACCVQTNSPTGGGVLVVVVVDVDVDVDVDVLVEDEVAGLVVVVLLVVVGMIVVVVDEVLVDVDTRVLVPVGGSVVREGELLGAAHPLATRTRVMIGSVTSLVN